VEGNLGDEIIRLWIMSQSSVALHLTRDNIATEDDDGPVDKVVFLSRDLSTEDVRLNRTDLFHVFHGRADISGSNIIMARTWKAWRC